jgi:AraC-like DNA-binding protein
MGLGEVMEKPVFCKSDYTAPETGSRDPFGQLFYEISGVAEPEKLFKIIPDKPGLTLSFIASWTHDYPRIEFEVKNAPVGFSFFLSGSCIQRIKGLAPEKTIKLIHKPGMNMVSSLPNIAGEMDVDPNQSLACVDLKIDQGLLFSYLEEKLDQVSPKVLELFDSKKKNYFSGPMSREMVITAQQITQPPSYIGSAKTLFYESRALELLAMQLERLAGKTLFSSPFHLSRSDLESIHTARQILLKDIQNPPSITNLARLCGINEFKLKKGFKQTFNTTIFACLKKYRMETAWHMFTDQSRSVTEAASMVGYTNISHFSAAFRKQFNISPGTLKKSWKTRQATIPPEPDGTH